MTADSNPDTAPTTPEVVRVMEALEAGAGKAQQDPNAPVYHFRPLAGWMNDVNALFHHRGYYHLFFQLHPFSTALEEVAFQRAFIFDILFFFSPLDLEQGWLCNVEVPSFYD